MKDIIVDGIENLVIPNKVDGKVIFRHRCIKGSIYANYAKVTHSIDLSHMCIGENIHAARLTTGELDVRESKISGVADFDHSQIKENCSLYSISGGEIDFKEAYIGINMGLSGANLKRASFLNSIIGGVFTSYSSTFEGDLILQNTEINRDHESIFTIEGPTYDFGAYICKSEIKGNLILREAQIKLGLDLSNTKIHGDLYLENATISRIQMNGLEVGGKLYDKGCTYTTE